MAVAAVEQNPVGVFGVPSDQVMAVWSQIEPLLRRVVKPETGETPESVLTDIQMRKYQLWVINDFQGLVITSILDRPVHRILFVPFMVGDHMSDWLDDWVAVQEGYAREMNCAAIEFNGRRGWNKIGEKYPEYRPRQTIFRREL